MMAPSDDTVLVERRDAVAIVTLDRPTRRNGMTVAMCRALHARLGEIGDSDVRVVILRGAGSDFSVGADIDDRPPDREGRALLDFVGSAFESATRLHHLPQVTIAAIDGACAGGAFGWAAACDLRLASTRARFATAFLKVGASGDMALIWSLTRTLGAARARELMLMPEKIGAEHALALGLVTRLHEPDALHAAALAEAERLAAAPAFALRMMKANLLSAETLPYDAYVEIEKARMVAVAEGGSVRRGFADFRAARAAD
jgi:2-(1,2-epoxy-1,2-dihydrophenyl)acetyl-CoA isomerase